MATTSWVDFTAEVREIPNRTDSAGASVNDLPLREDALINAVLAEGVVTPAGAFQPAKGTGDFDVDIGSGSAGADIFVVASNAAGQQPYLVTLEQSSATVTLDAADADPRIDEIYLVVRDDGVDSNSDGHRLPRLSYRKGDPATSNPSAPGPDSEWQNYARLASISVAGGATSITGGDVTDDRNDSTILQRLFDASVRATGASVFGDVLDSRYVNESGDTVSESLDWTAVQQFLNEATAFRTGTSGGASLDFHLDASNGRHIIRGYDSDGAERARLDFRLDSGFVDIEIFGPDDAANPAARMRLDHANGRIEILDGALVVPDPTQSNQAAHKGYVDDRSASGTYPGDGSATRTIDVGFTPSYVSVQQADTSTELNAKLGIAMSTVQGIVVTNTDGAVTSTTFKIVTNGFQVGGGSALNNNGVNFAWFAYR